MEVFIKISDRRWQIHTKNHNLNLTSLVYTQQYLHFKIFYEIYLQEEIFLAFFKKKIEKLVDLLSRVMESTCTGRLDL